MRRQLAPRDLPAERRARVRVRIASDDGYPAGTADALNGARGIVIKLNPLSYRGRPAPGPAYLVQLAKPVKAWWEADEMVSEFWFAKQDLRLLVDDQERKKNGSYER